MPKEYIYDQYNGQTFDEIADDGSTVKTKPEYRFMKVGWSRDNGVAMQIYEAPNGMFTPLASFSASDAEPTPGEGPVYLNLSRGEVNRLISILRKARDQAYGKDA